MGTAMIKLMCTKYYIKRLIAQYIIKRNNYYIDNIFLIGIGSNGRHLKRPMEHFHILIWIINIRYLKINLVKITKKQFKVQINAFHVEKIIKL